MATTNLPSRARLAAAVLTAAIAFAPLPAAALEARASGNVPVRAGPATWHAIIDRLVDGEYYEVLRCQPRKTWCVVGDEYGALGWVRGSQIVGEAAKNRVTPFRFLVNPDIFDRRHRD